MYNSLGSLNSGLKTLYHNAMETVDQQSKNRLCVTQNINV